MSAKDDYFVILKSLWPYDFWTSKDSKKIVTKLTKFSVVLKYSDNQKKMEYKDVILAIPKRFDVVTKQISLLVT